MKADKRTSASVVFEPDLLAEIDARAHMLDLTRSQYLRRLAREDLERSRKAAEPKQDEMFNKQEVAA